VRLVRIILEGLLVTAVAALVFYPLRHHPVAGLVLVIIVCLIGIGAITLIERRLARRKTETPGEALAAASSKASARNDGAASQASDEPDLLVTADGTQIHVRNNGPRAEFTAEIANLILPNGTESTNKHASLSWVRQDEDQLSMDIPRDATRTIVLWEIDMNQYARPIPNQSRTSYVHLLAWSDHLTPVEANQAMGVRIRFVRSEPSGFTDRIVTIGNRTTGDANSWQQSWYCDVAKP